MTRFRSLLLAGAIGVMTGITGAHAIAAPIKNIVLVHGAFADGSGWKPVYDRLVAKGYKVSVVQEPETSLEADIAATRRVIDMADGPVVLVAHSWGGQVITGAGIDPKVKSLVYLAALMPKPGESTATLETMPQFPPPNNDVKTTPDGQYFYLDPAKYRADFAADSPASVANFMAHSQVFLSVEAFKTPVTAAAWQTKPTWAVLPTADKTINPKLERWMYDRAHAQVTVVPGSSHTVFLSHPDLVVSVIEKAAAVQP
ncbi:alpha/beta hydrolase [Acidisoma cellulosilytica]|uniref:Alpha/beta hydrolase n=1 Tax=Acidisoma cellulosilyticum TaxID=2802395 RepID=A0A963Z502_9PROT|nr:alpha/beta hydrolase [Acidisoma cellulosilyticum]MCB8882125.1 alpha/beta hydrolase [Acidisoma cellulosilyticum]